MSEILPNRPEHVAEAPATISEQPKSAEYSAADQTAIIEKAQAAVSSELSSSEQVAALPVVDDRPQFADHGVKLLRMRQNLTKIQNRLQPADRALSKVIHQPLVSKVSNAAADTVSRPSGLFGGGVTAFVGSVLYLAMAHSMHFSYNYGFFLLFFFAGFILGVVAEYMAFWLRRRQA